ncbi:MAG TPA: hypothetical protein VEP68_07205, partial [Anaeromyxobacteraceae bacterium]|nr:hypothetical protein [Anaeromyxobacteraceae bacterium]
AQTTGDQPAGGAVQPAPAPPQAPAGEVQAPATAPAAQPPAPPPPPPVPPPPPPAQPQPPPKSHPVSVGLVVGGGSSYGQSYFLIGGRIGYGLGLGFEVSLDGQWWTGGTPSLGKLAPGLLWVAPVPFRPYLGAYYAHWFVGSNYADEDAIGGRVGFIMGGAGRVSLALGVAYEHAFSCSVNCDAWFPEAMAGVSF